MSIKCPIPVKNGGKNKQGPVAEVPGRLPQTVLWGQGGPFGGGGISSEPWGMKGASHE